MERGIWPFSEVWFSICSKHQIHDPKCQLCQCGTWKNKVKLGISSKIFKIAPALWRWWANRKPISFSRKDK